MSTDPPDLRVISLGDKRAERAESPPVDNQWAVDMVRKLLEIIQNSSRPITAVGAAVCFDDGSVGTVWNGNDKIRLAGGIEVLRTRLGREFE